MDPELINVLKEILATLKGIEASLKDQAVENTLQQINKVLGVIAQNGTTP